jgi:ABC-2 type transport system permease protein
VTASGIATVARPEFRLRIRAGRWRWLLAIWFVVLLGFTLLLRGALSGEFTGDNVLFKGTVIYGGLMLFVLGLALLVVPALAAQSVNGDRERGTLATLQVTRLSPAEITLGKFVAAWGTSLVFLALTLPLVVFAMTQKGVPFTRFLIVTLVIALLLGTVCAISLALSALLSRTSTSGVLAYLAVFALTLGTLISFALVTAVTAEEYTQPYNASCPTRDQLEGMAEEEKDRYIDECQAQTGSYTTTRARTDRTWWLLAPNPFVILADAAPQLPEETPAQRRDREAREQRGESVTDARDLDPLGQIGSSVRDLRDPPEPLDSSGFGYFGGPGAERIAETLATEAQAEEDERRPVWPYGLAFNVLLAVLSLWVTTRRVTTPTRNLPRGQRVA